MDMGHEMDYVNKWMMDLVYVMDHRLWTLFKEFELVHLLIKWIGY